MPAAPTGLWMEAFKVRLDGTPSTWWSCSCSLQGHWTQWPLKVPSNSNNSMILWVPRGPRHQTPVVPPAWCHKATCATDLSGKVVWSMDLHLLHFPKAPNCLRGAELPRDPMCLLMPTYYMLEIRNGSAIKMQIKNPFKEEKKPCYNWNNSIVYFVTVPTKTFLPEIHRI